MEKKEFQDAILEALNQLNKKIDDNHIELMGRLDRLENNQNAIKEFIINTDNTFKTAEEDHKFIANLKKVVSE
ncbi:hypothetical protein [Clostridium oryzae]|uniref:Uncharacterized protein n=1 Tax=Clostridium oryzae TaxID=1450648 RepID=A0A1V4J080_9CLOT|nr:hypothetical protein [Clostridium oryzae]OPJ65067.1 hypothetical protein CLORY_00670 [Clostridium oryzae]